MAESEHAPKIAQARFMVSTWNDDTALMVMDPVALEALRTRLYAIDEMVGMRRAFLESFELREASYFGVMVTEDFDSLTLAGRYYALLQNSKGFRGEFALHRDEGGVMAVAKDTVADQLQRGALRYDVSEEERKKIITALKSKVILFGFAKEEDTVQGKAAELHALLGGQA